MYFNLFKIVSFVIDFVSQFTIRDRVSFCQIESILGKHNVVGIELRLLQNKEVVSCKLRIKNVHYDAEIE